MSRNMVQLNPGFDLLDRDTPLKWCLCVALFRPPLPEPDLQVSKHPALQFRVSSWRGHTHLTYHSRALRYSLLPFSLSQALLWAFGYYGNSVAMGLAPFRQSRLYVQWTFSVFRTSVRLLTPFVTGYSLTGTSATITSAWLRRTVSSLQVCCDGCKIASLEARIQPIQAYPLSCTQDLRNRSTYIPSGLSALLTCWFSPCLSTQGKSVVLGNTLSQSPPLRRYPLNAETAHLVQLRGNSAGA